MPQRRAPLALAVAVAVAVAGMAGAGGWALAVLAEGLTAQRTAAALAGMAPWAQAEADGLALRLTGDAPDAAAARDALAAVGAAAPLARIDDALDRPPAAAVLAADAGPAPPPAAPLTAPLAAPGPADEDAPFTLVRDAGGIGVAGPASAELIAALRAALADLPDPPALRDASLPRAGPPSALRLALARAAVTALAALPEAQAELRGATLRLSGRAPDTNRRAEVERMIRAAAPPGATLIFDLSVPPPAVSPFRVVAEISPSGASLLACDVQSAAERAAVRAAFATLGGRAAACRIAVGAPSARWGEAAAAGIAALAGLETARFSLIDTDAALIAPAGGAVGRDRLEAAGRALALVLPAGFSLRLIGPPAPPGPGADAEGAPQWLSIRVEPASAARPGGVTLQGAAPDRASAAVVAAYARARLGPAPLRDDLDLTDAAPPPAWRRAALAAIDALAPLDGGAARFDGASLRLDGTTTSVAALRAAHAALAPATAAGVAATSAVRVDLPALAAQLPLPPADCLGALTATVEAEPIGFAPGAAEIEPGSAAVLDRLAATLGRCRGLVVEIGGHTDSQGRAETNRALSEARAFAVLDALIARGAAFDGLSARGYGAALPVADNATEAGRARNRRIGFADAATGADAAQEAAGAVEGAE